MHSGRAAAGDVLGDDRGRPRRLGSDALRELYAQLAAGSVEGALPVVFVRSSREPPR